MPAEWMPFLVPIGCFLVGGLGYVYNLHLSKTFDARWPEQALGANEGFKVSSEPKSQPGPIRKPFQSDALNRLIDIGLDYKSTEISVPGGIPSRRAIDTLFSSANVVEISYQDTAGTKVFKVERSPTGNVTIAPTGQAAPLQAKPEG